MENEKGQTKEGWWWSLYSEKYVSIIELNMHVMWKNTVNNTESRIAFERLLVSK